MGGYKDWPEPYIPGGLLFHGDNKEVLAHLLANGFRGMVNLIYIDPPFDSGADYVRKVKLRGMAKATDLKAEAYTLGEQTQYSDIWANDNYLQFMYERLLLLKELLAENGSIFVHCDWRKSHHLRLLLDEIFGSTSFQAQIAWRSMTSSGYKGKKSIGKSHADILYYTKSSAFIYNQVFIEMTAAMRARYKHIETDGRRFKDSYLGDATPETIEKLRNENMLYVTSKGGNRIKHYLEDARGTLADDVWTDIDVENSQASAQTDYPTQKPEALLERIIELACNPGDLVLDCFSGSGTAVAMAQKLGRQWIGCDINKGAIQTTSKRLQNIICDQINIFDKSASSTPQATLPNTNEEKEEIDSVAALPTPAQLAFSVWRVNDYDLQIQHNEAVELACEHIGVTRTRNDSFFDGTRGGSLVKIVPFNHPLSPQDLEQVRIEVDARPDELRPILMVCLGVELAAAAWIEDWNRMRKKTDPNYLDYIELRTDPKYGKFFEHKPASAILNVTHSEGQCQISIDNFASPTILERLAQSAGVLQPQIDDWRAMVDCVLVDTNYDGNVFNITHADVPTKKSGFVNGIYDLPLPAPQSTIAVKIIDMLGEEVLYTYNAESASAT